MNPIVLQFANGNVFFAGLALVLGASVASLRRWGRFFRSFFVIISLLGIILVVLSAAPLSAWSYALWFGLCLAELIGRNRANLSGVPGRRRNLLFAAAALASTILTFLELPYHFAPTVSLSSKQPIYVIGDSISAGFDSKERAWPLVLGDLAHLKVTNLARPGATAESALAQVSKIMERDCLVIVEIGGNDLISGTDSHAFYDQLDQLLRKLSPWEHQIVMLEIPLFPFRNGFGAAQRELAKKYGVTLLPKKFLTNVFGLRDATADGLHFSQIGHDALAKEIYSVLSVK